MALYSVGIPTFNRLAFLKQSLASALAQQVDDLEVLISDNASTDGTEEWCRSLSDPRIKYIRSPENRGPAWNFANCLCNSTGVYFSWLQDDDIIFSDFAPRAVASMDCNNADGYLATAIYGESPSFIHWDSLYSPPVPLDWQNNTVTIADPVMICLLSLFVSVAIPPVISFRREFLNCHNDAYTNSNFPLFSERFGLAQCSISGKLIIAPHIAGLFRNHADQYHKTLQGCAKTSESEWVSFARSLDRLATTHSLDLSSFQNILEKIPLVVLKKWFSVSNAREKQTSFEQTVHENLESEIMGRSGTVAEAMLPIFKGKSSVMRETLRLLCPPILPAIVRLAVSTIGQLKRT